MRPVLRPGSVVLRRDRAILQTGTAPRDAQVMRDAPGAVELLRLLDGVRDVEALRAHPGAPASVPALVAELAEAGVVVDADRWHRAPPGVRGEAAHLACRGVPAGAAADRLAARAASTVEVEAPADLAGLATLVTRMLGGSGVPAEQGRLDRPSVVVRLSARPSPRAPFDVLLHERLPHLPVVLEHGRARIGPFVDPGRTPCVACDDAERRRTDPAWPALVAQLDQPVAEAAPSGHDGLSVLTRHLVAVAVVAEVLAALDGEQPATSGGVLCLGPGPWELESSPVPLDPGCACRLVGSSRPGARSAGTMGA